MANEKRLIDANALDEKCRRQMNDEWNKRVAPVSWAEAYKEFLDDVWDAPTVDAVEVVHGRWDAVFEYEDFQYAYCSACGKRSEYMTNYCPNCGAKMDGDGNA